MTQDASPHPFDAYYYATGCGQPYEHNEAWLAFFDNAAWQIQEQIAPGNVLDAGCAMGFLVETLRDRGIAAYGVDISEYAISQAREDIRPFVRVGSLTEPLDRRYDLITCIEVVEHMEPQAAEAAIANLCAHSDDILFSSSPFDFKEVTHRNVRMPEEWAESFARHSFYRDVDFNASFIAPWTVRFRRRSEPPARIVREYERSFWRLWQENFQLREQVVAMRDELAQRDGGARPAPQGLRARLRAWARRQLEEPS